MKLTHSSNAAILSVPCNSKVGIRNPFETGAKTPLSLVVFSFLLAVFVTGLFRAKFVMTGKSYWGGLCLAAPVRGISNPTRTPPPNDSKLLVAFSQEQETSK
jgi:hypothetical protein